MFAMLQKIQVPGMSWSVLALLLLIFAASVAMFTWQVWRWTRSPGWRALLDWSRERGFRLSRPQESPAEPLDRLAGGAARVTTCLEKSGTRIVQLEIPAQPGAPAAAAVDDPSSSPGIDPAGPAPKTQRWHVLVRQIRTTWPATGLRPTHAPASLLDLFSLSSYPRMGEIERFTVFGTDSQAARVLSKSQARALLPADIGLLLHGRYLVLDFSTRPFDGIELGRIVALAEQLEQHLPVA